MPGRSTWPNITPYPDPCQREEPLRAVLLSHEFADPAKRGKLRALAGLGVTVAAAVPSRWLPPGGGSVEETAWSDDAGVQIIPVAVRGPLDDPADLRWHGKAFRRLLADFRPDVVQIEAEPWTATAALGMAAAARLGVPAVVATRQSLPQTLGPMERLRRDRVLRRVEGIVAANGIAAKLVAAGRPALPLTVIPSAGVTPPPLSLREPGAALAIGFLGRLVPERGLDLLFRACVGLPGQWTVTVVGTGPSQEELEALAERLGIAARVHWLGALPRQAIDAVWPTLDCVALPSRTTERWLETFGRAALEAMAHGLPVVASNSGVLPEIVDNAGRIVPEDDVPALSTALGELLADPGLRTRLGAIGRRRVMEEFSDGAVARRTLEFWQELAARRTDPVEVAPTRASSATA